MSETILIIEDDEIITELLKDYLELNGFDTICIGDGAEALRFVEALQTNQVSLILLDLMLPNADGFAILEAMGEEREIPVLILSAKTDDMYKLKGFSLGADDYITKPFSSLELVARINAHIKKYKQFAERKRSKPNKQITVRGLTVDSADRRVFVDGNEVTLKQKEYELLLFLLQNPNTVYDKEKLFLNVWGYDAISDATTVTVHIARIRDKIEKNPAKPEYIETVWGAGYRFRI